METEDFSLLLNRAAESVLEMTRNAGPGDHFLIAATEPPGVAPLYAFLHFKVLGAGSDAMWAGDFRHAADFTETVAQALSAGSGSVVMGAASPEGEKRLYGWVIKESDFSPLSAHALQEQARVIGFGKFGIGLTYRDAFPLLSSGEVRT